ncbi:heparinase II/III family protein [Ideonella sp.]|uniref:heparinase II/III domain-containing protein n=1 Tax=Ideonella sp. TaxID=1929293 RepID=UPI0035AEFC01
MRLRLRRGFIVAPRKYRMPELAWQGGIDYGALESAPESYKWWLNCFGYLRCLLRGDFAAADRAIVRAIVSDWMAKNPRGAPASGRAWDGHAVALRARVLGEVFLRGEDWLRPLLAEHAAFLAADENYQGHWNHGVDQSIALVDVAQALGLPECARIGADRLAGALTTVVDEQGATIEQAISYQLYSYKQLATAVDRLRAVGVDADVTDRWNRMPLFLAHATRPDGTYFCLGDTEVQAATAIPGTAAEYAATQGREGIEPAHSVAVYERAGYVFGRSGWGRRRPFAEETAFALRFGPPRAIHGHLDHTSLTYFSRGTEILRDGGFHGYTDDAVRAHLRAPAAHNVAMCTDPARRALNPHTTLSRQSLDPRFCHLRMEDEPSIGVRRRRDVVVFFEPECVVVMDRLDAATPVRFQQVWHFGDQCELVPMDDTSYRDERLGFTVRQLWPLDDLEHLPAGSGRQVALCAGAAMYDTCFAPTLVATRHGRQAKFLTVFTFDEAGIPLHVHSDLVRSGGVRRQLQVSSPAWVGRVTQFEDGELACEVAEAG